MKIASGYFWAALVAGATPAAQAAELRAAYGNWGFDVSGTATNSGNVYDFQRDLAAHSTARHSLSLAWDTGPGWWPDLALSDSSIGAAGTNTAPRSVQVLPPPAPPSTTTTTMMVDAGFRDQDLVARYPWGWGPLQLAAGIAVKRMRGTVEITDSSQSQPSRGDYDETFPELHGQLRWPLGRWLTLTAVGQGVQYQDSRALEWRVGAEMPGFAPLLLEAGWQQKRYNISVNGDALDASLSGVMLRAGVVWR